MLDAKGWDFLACRVLALYILYWAIRHFIEVLPGFAYMESRETIFFDTIFPILFAGSQFAVFLVFWFSASWISPKMVPKETKETPSWHMGQGTSHVRDHVRLWIGARCQHSPEYGQLSAEVFIHPESYPGLFNAHHMKR
jgi:hypothetical protein